VGIVKNFAEWQGYFKIFSAASSNNGKSYSYGAPDDFLVDAEYSWFFTGSCGAK